MITCGSCLKGMRKGTARRALVWEDGTMVSRLVCTRCRLRAVAFVVPPPTTIAPLCKCCKKDRAQVCGECFEGLLRHIKQLTAANVALRQGKKVPELTAEDLSQ